MHYPIILYLRSMEGHSALFSANHSAQTRGGCKTFCDSTYSTAGRAVSSLWLALHTTWFSYHLCITLSNVWLFLWDSNTNLLFCPTEISISNKWILAVVLPFAAYAVDVMLCYILCKYSEMYHLLPTFSINFLYLSMSPWYRIQHSVIGGGGS